MTTTRASDVVEVTPAAETSAAGAIDVRGVSKSYKSQVAVRAMDLAVGGQEFVTLLGPSGSGKSTLLKMIAGFEKPDAGSISIDGVRVDRVAPEKRGIGFVFQNYALFPHLTVAENVAFALRVRRMPKQKQLERVSEMLGLVSLSKLGDRYPSQLSGGQQQRVALARALAFRPNVVLMDEPLGALDRQLRGSMQLEIRRLHRELESTVIYVTHDQEEAFTLADRVGVVHDGRIHQVGTPAEVYERPASRFVATFVGDANLFRAAKGRTRGSSLVLTMPSGFEIDVPDVGGVLHPAGILRPEKFSLVDTIDEQVDGPSASAAVTDVVFVGDASVYTVDSPELGTGLKVRQHNRSTTPRFAPGDRATLRWNAADMWTVDDDGA